MRHALSISLNSHCKIIYVLKNTKDLWIKFPSSFLKLRGRIARVLGPKMQLCQFSDKWFFSIEV